jgi:parvulin-like peptidyl-prolyl isomerase
MKIKVRHILIANDYEVKDILKKLSEGESFIELAQDFSIFPSGKNGGDLGEFGRGAMVEAFETAAFALKIDEISAPVRTQYGFHLIQRYS